MRPREAVARAVYRWNRMTSASRDKDAAWPAWEDLAEMQRDQYRLVADSWIELHRALTAAVAE